MYRQKYLTQTEIEFLMEQSTDEDEPATLVGIADRMELVLLPPSVVDVSDIDEIDEDVQPREDGSPLFQPAGKIEVTCEFDDDNRRKPFRADDDESNAANSSPCKRVKSAMPHTSTAKWTKTKEVSFARKPVSIEHTKIAQLYKTLGTLTPIELFLLFVDEEVIDWIVVCTFDYARNDKNDATFATNASEMLRFIGILFVTGYSIRPVLASYWSPEPSIKCQIVHDAMTFDRFKRLRNNLHLCDNRQLNADDKFSKITPLNDLMNRKFLQFGVFAHNICIDEQIITYYGRHSCNMQIKGIRFGYKYWNLCSEDGYLFGFIPYEGASDSPHSEFGEQLVLQLMSKVANPAQHCVAFDHYFTTHKLMARLSEQNYFATGAIRNDRTHNAPLTDVRQMNKQEHGSLDYVFDEHHNLVVARWKDRKSVVTIVSNHEPIEPMHRVRQLNRETPKVTEMIIEMPQVLKAYNQRMGGVELFDSAIRTYRIGLRWKKWYWPLFTNLLDAAMVNAWKMHCLLRKHEWQLNATKGHTEPFVIPPHFEFRVHVTEALLKK